MFNLATDTMRPVIRRGLMLALLVGTGLSSQKVQPAQTEWFPDPPSFRHYAWSYAPCPGCAALVPRPEWVRMAALAGLQDVRFVGAPDESNGPAYSAAPNVIVLTPSALKLEHCQLVFVVGHELVHIAQRHFDEDAIALSVYAGKLANWTTQGEDAMQLTDGDFGLALRISHLWQEQEREADWMGALLAAQGAGCGIESGAMAYLRSESEAGGGIAAAHAPSAERIRLLLPFTESARRLAEREPF